MNTPAASDVPTLPARIDRTLHDRVSNTRLHRTWIVPGLLDDAAADLDVAATVFGGLASSRLDNALVRGDETAVAVTGAYLPFHRIGMFEATVDVKEGEDADAVGVRLEALLADFIANGPSEDEVARVVATRISQRIQALEPVGGFTGKAVVLAEGELYADDPGFYRREMAAYGAVTPASVKAAVGRWLTRPVLALRVDPGEREPYAEAADDRPAPHAAESLAVTPRDPMPALGQMKPLDFPAVERARLSNGLEVVYARSTTVPITRVAIEFDAGVSADAAGHFGTQRMMVDMLTEGTTTRDAVALAEQQERLGATITAAGSADRTIVSMTAVSANLAPSLDLLIDVVRNPAFAPADIERQRDQQLAAIAQERTQPAGMGGRVLPALLYGPDHPYGRPFSGLGDAATVGSLGRDDLTAFHQAWIRPDNAQVFVVSDRPLSELTPMLEAGFGAWTAPAPAKGFKAFDTPIPAPTPRLVLVDRPQSPQSLILGGLVLPVTGQDDLVTLNAANEVIGNGFLSRINQDIRETRGWSYGLSGRVNTFEHQTPYLINAPVQANRTGESVAALIDQYRGFLSDRGVTAAERDRTVNGNVNQLPGGFESSAAVLNALRSNALFGRPDDYWETLAPRYQAMTAADMDVAARRVLDGSRMIWVIVGDASVIRPQLEALGLPVEVRAAE